MQSQAKTVGAYLAELDDDRRAAISGVRAVILSNLPSGYEEVMQFGMITYVVPFSVLAKTYNRQPLMYLALASQKNYMSLYLTNVYADGEILAWFRERYLATEKKLNMGKSCLRFKKLDDLPLELIGEVIAKTPIDEFVALYQKAKAKPGRC